jgi:uncharacterized protein YjiS (DUF1127 family)
MHESLGILERYSRRHRSRIRYQLGDLDDHVLKDVGLSRYERFIETSRLSWR